MVAANLVTLGVELEGITTRRRLADGLRTAFEHVNVTVSPRRPSFAAQPSVNGKT
jgi:hypothetical protein